MLEVGQNSFEQVQALIEKNDTDVTLKLGLIIVGNQGSLIALRDAIKKALNGFGGVLVFHQFTAQPIYLVHYNDLSPAKQATLSYKARE